MDFTPRVLDAEPVGTLEDYVSTGGGTKGLDAARKLGPAAIIDEVEASGLRGRGGGGFPTGTKWRTVVETSTAAGQPPTVVVNGAEGEPGTFKDRAILRRNPYRVIEGALVAAMAVGASRVVIGLKASFTEESDRLRSALREVEAAGWNEGVEIAIMEGPEEYLLGEETGLLEVIEGRRPFPRIAPPYRHGVDDDVPAPTLVNNVETLANVPGILAEGADWFRSLGTAESPGTIVCTVSGKAQRHGVAEFPMGTPLRTVIDSLGGGATSGQQIVGAMSGVANTVVPADKLDTPLTYEGMEAIGSGLGAEGFIVFDDATDMAAVAHGVARFLAVESCGQCTPCKQDGLAIAGLLDDVRRSAADENTLAAIDDHLVTVTDEARCFLAHQQQRVINSIMQLFDVQITEHVTGARPEAEREVIAPITGLEGNRFTLAEEHLGKQPDWTYDEVDSGQYPAQRIDYAEGETT